MTSTRSDCHNRILLLLTSHADMGRFSTNSFEYTHMETKLDAQSAAHQIAQQRLMTHELKVRDDLRIFELDTF